MGLDAFKAPVVDGEALGGGGTMGYLDSSVFLILFILGGRWLEGVSKIRTGDAIAKLGDMKVSEGILIVGREGGKEEPGSQEKLGLPEGHASKEDNKDSSGKPSPTLVANQEGLLPKKIALIIPEAPKPSSYVHNSCLISLPWDQDRFCRLP